MLKEGDSYVHFTKYGGIQRGIVESIRYTKGISTTTLCVYEKPYMVNDRGIVYDLDGSDGKFYKVTDEIDKAEAERIDIAYAKLKARKPR